MSTGTEEQLRNLVAFDTVSDPARGKRPTVDCPKYITSCFEDLGLAARTLKHNGVYSSLAETGEGDFRVLFLAHFDVVPVGEGWKTDPFRLVVDGDRAYGRGTCDDKGNVTSLILLAERLAQNKPPCNVMLAATGDEEVGGANGAGHLKDYLSEQSKSPDYVVVADGVGQQMIFRRRNVLPTTIRAKRTTRTARGRAETVRFTTETYGNESRHSAYMQLGVDRHAMLTASKYLDLHPDALVRNVRGAFVKSNVVPDWVELDLVHPDEAGAETDYDATLTGIMRLLLPISHSTFPTMFSERGAMISPNLLKLDADTWDLYCDVRAMTNEGGPLRETIMKVLKPTLRSVSVDVSDGAGYVDSDPQSRLIRTASWALKQQGMRCQLIEGFGASDSRFFSRQAQVFDFGPLGENLHGANEWVLLHSIEENAKFFHRLIDGLVQDPTGFT